MAEPFVKTTITVTILSRGAYSPDTLGVIEHDMIHGDVSGAWEVTDEQELTRDEMAKALQEQGSDPEFLLGEELET